MAECSGRQVKCNSQILRLLLLQHFFKDVEKSVDSIGMHPVGSRHREGNPIKSPKQNTVPVYEQQFTLFIIHYRRLSPLCF